MQNLKKCQKVPSFDLKIAIYKYSNEITNENYNTYLSTLNWIEKNLYFNKFIWLENLYQEIIFYKKAVHQSAKLMYVFEIYDWMALKNVALLIHIYVFLTNTFSGSYISWCNCPVYDELISFYWCRKHWKVCFSTFYHKLGERLPTI